MSMQVLPVSISFAAVPVITCSIPDLAQPPFCPAQPQRLDPIRMAHSMKFLLPSKTAHSMEMAHCFIRILMPSSMSSWDHIYHSQTFRQYGTQNSSAI